MKKLLLLSDGWKRYVTYSWPHSIMAHAKEIGLDLSIYMFQSNGNLSHDAKMNKGEYAIYDIPHYEKYDGVVFDCTNTTDIEQIRHMTERLKGLGIPVVSISYYVDGFYYVGNNNKGLFRRVIDHLYKDHNCRSFVFAGGPEYNYENKERYTAFVEAMREYKIPITPDMVMFGDYDFSTGVKYAREWIESGRPLPDAFVCANDNIAAGLCSEAEKHGIKIPQDVKVTGFDNLDKAAYYKPQITSVDHNRGNIGYTALDVMVDIWNGKKVEPFTYLNSEIYYGESCGCANNGRVDYRMYAKSRIEEGVTKDKCDEELLELETRLNDCNNVEGVAMEFSSYMNSMDCGDAYILVDKKLMAANLEDTFPKGTYKPDDLEVLSATERHKKIYTVNTNAEMIEYLEERRGGNIFIFFPIHFRDESVGCTILKNPGFLYRDPVFADIHSTFVDKLYNLYRMQQISNAANVMKDMYNRDPMTGMYNRLAYTEIVKPKFQKFDSAGIPCAMLFFDVDRFKQINDSLGHDYGDRVLITIASVLLKFKPKDGYAFRFGGDEFVVFFPYAKEGKINRFLEDINSKLSEQNIQISTGIIVTEPGSHKSLEDYLTFADGKMYEEKQKRKASMTGDDRKYLPKLLKDDGLGKFYRGMDISSLPEREDGGAVFYDLEGNKMDAFELLTKYRVNSVRLRIWNEPEKITGKKGYCNLEETLKLAERIRNNGLHFLLDFHYSDYWADPGQQRKPIAWENLEFDDLCDAVYDYTKHVLFKLSEIDALPDIVQVGNEIRSGLLFPDGAVPNYRNIAMLVNSGIRAVRSVSPDIKVMIHLDQGGRFYNLKEWLDSVISAGLLPIDIIGISFYSFWHGTYMDLKATMTALYEKYDLPVYVVETAHPWRQCKGEHVPKDQMLTAGFPAGKEEQKKALQVIMQIAGETSDGRDTGVYYWEPLGIPGRGFGSWDENMGMLNEDGKALPAFEVFSTFKRKKPPIENLDEYIEDLYKVEPEDVPNPGTNLIPNGDFSDGIMGWWSIAEPKTVKVTEGDNEVAFSSETNFSYRLFREIRIVSAGKYVLSVSYRGTSTTGANVKLILKTISFEGEKYYYKDIYPSDVAFITHSMDPIYLPAGPISIGIEVIAPPIMGRIKNISLVKIDEC